jgi:predicted HTH transcriptional regulator
VEATPLLVTAIEAQFDERQTRILVHALEIGSVTRRWCVTAFGVVNDTAGRGLKSLVDLGLLAAKGQGRSVRYVVPAPSESTGKRPT